jgi:type I restriction enzyme S subunit
MDFLVLLLRFLNLNHLSYDGSQPVISGKRVYPLPTPLPPLAEQAAIVERVEALMATCRALEAEIEQSRAHAAHLLQAVLKEAFAPAS